MMIFIGEFESRADEKGRIVLPSAFKKSVSNDDLRFVVRKDLFENCLIIYPYSYWKEELDNLRKKLNPYNRKHKQFLRDFFRGSAEIILDGNGRFLIPRRLMELVEANRDVILAGVDRHIELWAAHIYNLKVESPGLLADLAESILGNSDK